MNEPIFLPLLLDHSMHCYDKAFFFWRCWLAMSDITSFIKQS